jgi:hypothetical protein
MSKIGAKLKLNSSPMLVTLQDGLERLFEVVQSDNFYFVVNGEQLKSTIVETALISPKLHQQLRFSPEIHTFRIDSDNFTSKDFSRFLEFVHSPTITGFSKEEQTSFLSICGLLGNIRLTFLILESLHGLEEIKKSNELDICEIDSNVCAAKFYDYSIDLIKRIEQEMLHELLSSSELKLESEDIFLKTLIDLGKNYFDFWEYIEVKNLTEEGISLFVEHLPFDELTESIWRRIVDRLCGSKSSESLTERYRGTVGFESLIVKDYPRILEEFERKKWKLLYRGSRDGFRVSNFHAKCDGQSNTLTLIETTKGFIFGGFTPLVWDSTTNNYKPDSSQKSFLFTLKNARNIEPRKFKLSSGSNAIYCHSSYGLTFGGNHDLTVADSCNANTNSYTNLGHAYVNDTGITGTAVFTGEQYFTVKEIEVFTITT